MLRLFVYFLVIPLSLNGQSNFKPKSIQIDVNRNDKVNLSAISKKVTPVVLKGMKVNVLRDIGDLILTDHYIFIASSEEGVNDFPVKILQFDITGNYIREVINTKGPRLNMVWDYDDKNLIVTHSGRSFCYDFAGNLLNTYNSTLDGSYYKNRLWGVIWRRDHDRNLYNLFYHDLKTNKSDTIFSLAAKSSYLWAVPMFSYDIENFYVSFRIDHTIYKVVNNKLYPAYKFKFSDGGANVQNFKGPPQIVLGDYLYFGYEVEGVGSQSYMYHIETGKGYNIQMNRNSFGEMVNGIWDDIYTSSYVAFRYAKKEGYAYYFRKNNSLAKRLSKQGGSNEWVLFIVKMRI